MNEIRQPRGLLGHETQVAMQFGELRLQEHKLKSEIDHLKKSATRIIGSGSSVLELPEKMAMIATGKASEHLLREWQEKQTTPTDLKASLLELGSDGHAALKPLEQIATLLPEYWEKRDAVQSIRRDMEGYCRIAYSPHEGVEKLRNMVDYIALPKITPEQ